MINLFKGLTSLFLFDKRGIKMFFGSKIYLVKVDLDDSVSATIILQDPFAIKELVKASNSF